MDTLYQPNGTGFDALDELDQVDWSQLEHSYGRGIVSLGAAGEVSLAIAGDVPDGIRVPLLALLGDISIGASYTAPDGSHSGALGDHVDVLVTESLATSMALLSTIQPRLVALIQAIQSLLVRSTDARRDAVESAIDFALTPPATP